MQPILPQAGLTNSSAGQSTASPSVSGYGLAALGKQDQGAPTLQFNVGSASNSALEQAANAAGQEYMAGFQPQPTGQLPPRSVMHKQANAGLLGGVGKAVAKLSPSLGRGASRALPSIGKQTLKSIGKSALPTISDAGIGGLAGGAMNGNGFDVRGALAGAVGGRVAPGPLASVGRRTAVGGLLGHGVDNVAGAAGMDTKNMGATLGAMAGGTSGIRRAGGFGSAANAVRQHGMGAAGDAVIGGLAPGAISGEGGFDPYMAAIAAAGGRVGPRSPMSRPVSPTAMRGRLLPGPRQASFSLSPPMASQNQLANTMRRAGGGAIGANYTNAGARRLGLDTGLSDGQAGSLGAVGALAPNAIRRLGLDDTAAVNYAKGFMSDPGLRRAATIGGGGLAAIGGLSNADMGNMSDIAGGVGGFVKDKVSQGLDYAASRVLERVTPEMQAQAQGMAEQAGKEFVQSVAEQLGTTTEKLQAAAPAMIEAIGENPDAVKSGVAQLTMMGQLDEVISQYADPIFSLIGMDPSSMSPMVKVIGLLSALGIGIGGLTGNSTIGTIAGLGMIGALGGHAYQQMGQSQPQAPTQVQQQPAAPEFVPQGPPAEFAPQQPQYQPQPFQQRNEQQAASMP